MIDYLSYSKLEYSDSGTCRELMDRHPHIQLLSKLPKTSKGWLGLFIQDEVIDTKAYLEATGNALHLPNYPQEGYVTISTIDGAIVMYKIDESGEEVILDQVEVICTPEETDEVRELIESYPLKERLRARYNVLNDPEAMLIRNSLVKQYWELPVEVRNTIDTSRIYNIHKNNIESLPSDPESGVQFYELYDLEKEIPTKEEEMKFSEIEKYLKPQHIDALTKDGVPGNTALKAIARSVAATARASGVRLDQEAIIGALKSMNTTEVKEEDPPVKEEGVMDTPPNPVVHEVNHAQIERERLAAKAQAERAAALNQNTGGIKMNTVHNEAVTSEQKIALMREAATSLEVIGKDDPNARMLENIVRMNSKLHLFVVQTDSRLSVSTKDQQVLDANGKPVFNQGFTESVWKSMQAARKAETVKQTGYPFEGKRYKKTDVIKTEKIITHKISKPTRPLAAIVTFPLDIGSVQRTQPDTVQAYIDQYEANNRQVDTGVLCLPLAKLNTLLAMFMDVPTIDEDTDFDNSMVKQNKGKHERGGHYTIEIKENSAVNPQAYRGDMEKLKKAQKRFKAWKLNLLHNKRTSVLTPNNYVAIKRPQTVQIASLKDEASLALYNKFFYGKISGQIVTQSKTGEAKPLVYDRLTAEYKAKVNFDPNAGITTSAYIKAEKPEMIKATHWGRFNAEGEAVTEEQTALPRLVEGNGKLPKLVFNSLADGTLNLGVYVFDMIEQNTRNVLTLSSIDKFAGITEADIIGAAEEQLAVEKKNNAASSGAIDAEKTSAAILELASSTALQANTSGAVVSPIEALRALDTKRMSMAR